MSGWPVVALGEVLTPASDPHPLQAETDYANLGILSFGRGTFRKPPIRLDQSSATTLFRVRAGQFIYSRLFAFEGAYAIVPDDLDGSFVSNEFPTFDVDGGRALPSFLEWLFRRPATWIALAQRSSGLGHRRQRIHPDRLLDWQFPLPPLPEQRRIVARLDRARALVAARGEAAARAGAEAAAALRAAFAAISARAPRRPLGDLAPLVRRPVAIDPDATYAEVGVRSFGRGLFRKADVLGAALSWQALFRIEPGDLVFSNIKAWEGAIAVADSEHREMHGSHRHLTCVPDPDRATARFLHYFLLSEEGRLAVDRASPGSADRNRTLAQARMLAIPVPAPSLDAQAWFDALQARAADAAAARARATVALDALLPAMLHEAFG